MYLKMLCMRNHPIIFSFPHSFPPPSFLSPYSLLSSPLLSSLLFSSLLFSSLSPLPQTKSVLSIGLFSNRMFLYSVGGSLLGQLLVVYFPPLQAVFQTEALTGWDLLFLASLCSTVLLVDELRKLVMRTFSRQSVSRSMSRNVSPASSALSVV